MSIYQGLYAAQASGQKVQSNPWLAPINKDYMAQKGVFQRTSLWLTDKAYDASSGIAFVWNRCYAALSSGVHYLGLDNNPLVDAVCPINIINGKRHFVLIPRSMEKWLFGIQTEIVDGYYLATNELLPGTFDVSIAGKVDEVFRKMIQDNQGLLNPVSETIKFNYNVRTIQSTEPNAFAMPAGAIRIYSQIIKEIAGALASKQIQSANVQFADNSQIIVDLSAVEIEDVIASLIGHELTHAASRHSIEVILANVILPFLCGLVLVYILPSEMLLTLCMGYATGLLDIEDLEEMVGQVTNILMEIVLFFQSRVHEYEADVTGAYLAHTAGYNPLGAIYLQEVFGNMITRRNYHTAMLTEAFGTHPANSHRKRSLFAAIKSFAPAVLEGVSVRSGGSHAKYDMDRATPAFTWVSEHEADIAQQRLG